MDVEDYINSSPLFPSTKEELKEMQKEMEKEWTELECELTVIIGKFTETMLANVKDPIHSEEMELFKVMTENPDPDTAFKVLNRMMEISIAKEEMNGKALAPVGEELKRIIEKYGPPPARLLTLVP